MSKDLDINNYSIEDLFAFFKIDEPINKTRIDYQINNTIRIFLEKFNNDYENEYIQFFYTCKDKIHKYLDTLNVDIDKTICESPQGKDYSKCRPIEPVCAKLREENNKGTYIILYTSRNVRTFKGNIGLLNKHTNIVLAEWLKNNNIPYDEIYFNKPLGFGDLNYIDDKFLSIEEFKSD